MATSARPLSSVTLALCLSVLGTGAGCRSAPPVDPTLVPPAWVSTPPTEPGYLYATGSWPRTLDMQDAKDRAVEQARAELARSISVKVQTVIRDWQSNTTSAFGASGLSREYTEAVSKSLSDTVLNGSEVREIWTDPEGRAGPAGTVYALVRMRTSQAVQSAQQTTQTLAEQKGGDPSSRQAVKQLGAELEKLK